MEQQDWEPQRVLASYPEENLETDDRRERDKMLANIPNKLQKERERKKKEREVTIFILTHGDAHSFLQVLRHQLGDPGQDVCDIV